MRPDATPGRRQFWAPPAAARVGTAQIVRSSDGRRGRAHTNSVGFLSRLLVPRSVRRAIHPVRTVKRAVTPKPIKQARRALHPVSNATYAVERDIATALRGKSRRKPPAPVYRHGNCPVRHRTPEAAAKCRNA